MALSILITQVGSTAATPTQYTAQSPSLARYRMTSTIVDYGDAVGVPASYPGGPVPAGFLYIQYHVDNQWKTATIYTAQTGAQLNTLVVA